MTTGSVLLTRIIVAILLLCAGWFAGLCLFIQQLPVATSASIPNGDGVVVYTGGGGKRIAAAMGVFEDGSAERLLISGVNPSTSRTRIEEMWTGAPEKFECCVDLGRHAQSTIGNADEAADWANDYNLSSLVLVTSDFHMPRALMETRSKLVTTSITPYAVPSGHIGDNGWPTTPAAWRLIAREYTKYLLAWANNARSALG